MNVITLLSTKYCSFLESTILSSALLNVNLPPVSQKEPLSVPSNLSKPSIFSNSLPIPLLPSTSFFLPNLYQPFFANCFSILAAFSWSIEEVAIAVAPSTEVATHNEPTVSAPAVPNAEAIAVQAAVAPKADAGAAAP